ncbi:barstar family protein [Streptomyces fructofermentans]|uniref:barstar family protein n=1 Tax=Streptomyces fructofermentans TaxID=152141 RepID=UPI003406FC44
MSEFWESWVDPGDVISGLPLDPYFVHESRRRELVEKMARAGFDVQEVDLSGITTERELLVMLGRSFSAPDYYGENWDALRDVLFEQGGRAAFRIALVFSSSDAFLRAQTHGFVRSVTLLQMLARDLSDVDEGCGQLEIFYLADWE